MRPGSLGSESRMRPGISSGVIVRPDAMRNAATMACSGIGPAVIPDSACSSARPWTSSPIRQSSSSALRAKHAGGRAGSRAVTSIR